MKLIYVTPFGEPHSLRFDILFKSLSENYALINIFDTHSDNPYIIIDNHKISGWNSIKNYLRFESTLLISGPLDEVSLNLACSEINHIAISYATDVMVSAGLSLNSLLRFKELIPTFRSIIVDNYATENALISMGLCSQRIIRVPWGPIDIPVARINDARTDFKIRKNVFTILYPRKLESHYQPHVFIKSLRQVVKKYPKILAVLISNGSLARDIRRFIIELNLEGNVQWVKPQITSKFHDLIHLSDAVVVSPKTDGTSVTILEAMHLGVPVISSLTSGSSEWVINGITGWSYPVGNSEELSNAIINLIELDPRYVKTVCDNAATLVSSKAGWARSSEILIKSLKKILHQYTL